MDQERTILIIAVGVAVAVGCFVLWGPGTFRPKRRKKGQVVGLVNLGHTCFLNTLLQALASCPTIVDWLCEQEDDDKDSLVSSLRTICQVLNGEYTLDVTEPVIPNKVISALQKHRWVISRGEQDAHELLHVLLETLEEETTKLPLKNGSISDALLEPSGQGDDHLIHKPVLKQSLNNPNRNPDGDCINTTLHPETSSQVQNGSMLHLDISEEVFTSRLHRIQYPFRGMLTSQLKCTACGFKSALRFDKFDTLSLHLPPPSRPTGSGKQHLTLQMLLDKFVSPEVVKDVTCTNCSRSLSHTVKTTSLKTLNFGKLPKCLCVHIVRTTWNREGLPWKREDYVDFPEFLTMDKYTHCQVQRTSRQQERGLLEQMSGFKGDDAQHMTAVNRVGSRSSAEGLIDAEKTETNPSSAKHMYRLKAVVVHTGDVHSGHFITYRKGPLMSVVRHRWYFTSDTVVRQATLCEALLSNAYMLFYEKYHLPS